MKTEKGKKYLLRIIREFTYEGDGELTLEQLQQEAKENLEAEALEGFDLDDFVLAAVDG